MLHPRIMAHSGQGVFFMHKMRYVGPSSSDTKGVQPRSQHGGDGLNGSIPILPGGTHELLVWDLMLYPFWQHSGRFWCGSREQRRHSFPSGEEVSWGEGLELPKKCFLVEV